MKRMTERDEFGHARIVKLNNADLHRYLDFETSDRLTEVLDRLADYEDTGLTPKQIRSYWRQGILILDKVPDGWKKIMDATTAPEGFTWYNNGLTMFGGEYKQALVKDAEI